MKDCNCEPCSTMKAEFAKRLAELRASSNVVPENGVVTFC